MGWSSGGGGGDDGSPGLLEQVGLSSDGASRWSCGGGNHPLKRGNEVELQKREGCCVWQPWGHMLEEVPAAAVHSGESGASGAGGKEERSREDGEVVVAGAVVLTAACALALLRRVRARQGLELAHVSPEMSLVALG